MDGLKASWSELAEENEILKERITELQNEMQQVSNDLYELYNKCADTTEPEIYGTILGLSERLERFLKGGGA